jgi:hypothetical protein
MIRVFDRRRFLSGLAAALAAPPALALTVDENAPRERLYLSACESRTAHDRLIRELVAQLEGDARDVAPQTHAQNIERVKAMSCPVCGCALGAIQPYPGRF